MTRPQADEQEDKPLDPAVESVRRKLVRFMAVNLGLLFLALLGRGGRDCSTNPALTRRPGRWSSGDIPNAGREPGAQTGDIVLTEGARIVSQVAFGQPHSPSTPNWRTGGARSSSTTWPRNTHRRPLCGRNRLAVSLLAERAEGRMLGGLSSCS